jgi:hypothetical protein
MKTKIFYKVNVHVPWEYGIFSYQKTKVNWAAVDTIIEVFMAVVLITLCTILLICLI